MRRRHALNLAATAALAWVAACAHVEPALDAPNVVPISERLVTSGQPSARALAQLAAQGFGAVVYLAPPTVGNAVPGEDDIVRGQGMAFVNIPIEFGRPSDADVRAFFAAMERYRDRKVLVHCEVNMRASSMTFLYRVLVERESPERAYDAVAAVWSPRGVWKRLIVDELTNAGVAFEPY